MLKVYRIDNFDSRKDHVKNCRRGFVIPFLYSSNNKVLFVTDGDLDHERLADNFISLTDEQIKDVILEQGFKDEEDFNSSFNEIKRIQSGYKTEKNNYPTSRKDYLLYEEGAVAFDSKSLYGKFILYRDNSRRFQMSRASEKIAFGYIDDGWKGEPIPDNPHIAGPTLY